MHRLLEALTGADNTTFEIGRLLLVFFSVALVLQDVIALLQGQAFDVAKSAMAYGGLLVAGCGAIRIKASTEPEAKQ